MKSFEKDFSHRPDKMSLQSLANANSATRPHVPFMKLSRMWPWRLLLSVTTAGDAYLSEHPRLRRDPPTEGGPLETLRFQETSCFFRRISR